MKGQSVKLKNSKRSRNSSSGSSSDDESSKQSPNNSRISNKFAQGSNGFSKINDQARAALQKGQISEALSKYSASNFLLFIVLISQGLDTIAKLSGLQSTDFIVYFTNTVEEINNMAMNYTKKRDTETAYELLSWCERVVNPELYGNFTMLRNITYNNLGCTFRRVGQLHHALRYLRLALDVLLNARELQNSAKTYLNLCAVLSQMGK